MPLVSAIKQQVKLPDRFSIYIDGRYGFSLTAQQLSDNGLATGQELRLEQVEELKGASLYGKALMAAYRLLSYRQRSYSELKQRLERKDYDEATIEAVLERLIELKLIGDDDFTQNLLAQPKSALRSKLRLGQDLRQKGIDPELARRQLDELPPDHEVAAIKQFVQKKLNKTAAFERQRLINQLVRQGFRFSVINQVLAEDFSQVHWL